MVGKVPHGASLDRLWPFEVPPERSKLAVHTSSLEAGITTGNADGRAWDEMSYGARLGDCVL